MQKRVQLRYTDRKQDRQTDTLIYIKLVLICDFKCNIYKYTHGVNSVLLNKHSADIKKGLSTLSFLIKESPCYSLRDKESKSPPVAVIKQGPLS